MIGKKLKSAYDRNSKYYNLRKRDIEFDVGDRLWKKNIVLSSKANNFNAKFAQVFSKVVYNIKDLVKKGNYHISNLKDRFVDVDDNLSDNYDVDDDNISDSRFYKKLE